MSSDIGNSDQLDWELANQSIESEFDERDHLEYQAYLDSLDEDYWDQRVRKWEEEQF
jgi:hypothetical protein